MVTETIQSSMKAFRQISLLCRGSLQKNKPNIQRPLVTSRPCTISSVETFMLIKYQSSLSSPSILLQVDSILHSTCNFDQSHRSCRIIQHNRWWPEKAWCDQQWSVHCSYERIRKMQSLGLWRRRGRHLLWWASKRQILCCMWSNRW